MWIIHWVKQNDEGDVYVFSEGQIKKWISDNGWKVKSYTVKKVS